MFYVLCFMLNVLSFMVQGLGKNGTPHMAASYESSQSIYDDH